MKKAFTLIELMVVASVIGFLSAIVIPRYSDVTQSAKVANAQGNLANLRTSIEMFNANNGRYPSYTLVSAKSTGDSGDISSEGDLSDEFVKYYSKGIMPETPGSDSASPANSVVTMRDNSGGWLYQEDRGYIFANLKNGNYTGDEDGEVWNEEEVSDPGDGENPGDSDYDFITGEDLGGFGSEDWIVDENGLTLKDDIKNGKGELSFDSENTQLDEISEISFKTEGEINTIKIDGKDHEAILAEGTEYIYTMTFTPPQPTSDGGFSAEVKWKGDNKNDQTISGIEFK